MALLEDRIRTVFVRVEICTRQVAVGSFPVLSPVVGRRLEFTLH